MVAFKKHTCGLYYYDTDQKSLNSFSDDGMGVCNTYERSMETVTASAKTDSYFTRNVVKQIKQFTRYQVKRATESCHDYGMVGIPTPKDFKNMVRGSRIKHCPTTHDDILTADSIWGEKYVNSIKRKTVRSQPHPVITDIVAIPRDILELHSDIFSDSGRNFYQPAFLCSYSLIKAILWYNLVCALDKG